MPKLSGLAVETPLPTPAIAVKHTVKILKASSITLVLVLIMKKVGMAASPMKKDIGGSPLPAQQIIFFYPVIESMPTQLEDDIATFVSTMTFNQLKSLSAIMSKMPFIKDNGTLHQVSEQIRVYKYAS